MSTADLPKREAPDSLMLTGYWYRALPSNHVSRGELQKAMLLEIPLVIGRDQTGKAFALRDACPHRGMPLSCGRFDGEQVECSYHGWRFEAQSGQCQLIPSLTADQNLKVDRIYAGNYACEERDDFVWVFIPDPGPASGGFSRREEPAAEAKFDVAPPHPHCRRAWRRRGPHRRLRPRRMRDQAAVTARRRTQIF